MKGIYKIITPSGYVYIGQSVNIKNRWKDHRSPRKRIKTAIGDSIRKHGWASHHFEIIHELPEDVDGKVMCAYESLYISLYREAGFTVLNITDVRGSRFGYKPSERLRQLNSERMKGSVSAFKGKTHTEEARKIMSEKAKLRIRKSGYKRKDIVWNKGKKLGNKYSKPGRIVSDGTREKLRLAGLGKKLSAETIAKRTATSKMNKQKKHALS